MPDPNFLIIGAQKCGTTWLYEMIRQHPEAFCPNKKELHFFNKRHNYEKGLDWYRAQFREYDGEKAIGEATPNYLWTTSDPREVEESNRASDIPKRVHRHYPDAKLIVALRDPVQRAVSAYYHHIRANRVPPHSSILDVMHRYGILSMGYYQRHLEHWMQVFTRDQFLILVFEDDIARDKRATLQRVFQFLEIDERFVSDNLEARPNARIGSLYRTVNHYAPWIKTFVKRYVPGARSLLRVLPTGSSRSALTDEERAELAQRYAAANTGLKELLDRPLPWPCMHEDPATPPPVRP